MFPGLVTEPRTVAKKKKAPQAPQDKPAKQPEKAPPATFGRIELQAPPEWVEELDRIAEAMGLSRSAYIRLACNRQMAADRKQMRNGGEE